MGSSVLVELIKELPQILTALGTVVVAVGTLVGVVLAYKNGRKADQISAKADVAAVAATGAHAQTTAIQATSTQIAEQTNGHLTAMREENRGLREMVTSLVAILAARERNSSPVRKDDPGAATVGAVVAGVVGRRSTDDEPSVST